MPQPRSKPSGGAKARKPSPRRKAAPRKKAGADDAIAALRDLREHLGRGVVLTAERLQEALDDAVARGRITRTDADDLVSSLIEISRKQTEDVMSDLERLAGIGTGAVASAGRVARWRVETTAARARKSDPADRVLREVDRVRRRAGVGSSFPILGYDELSAAQVSSRLTDLTAAQLRKVRDYERRNSNRKSVLTAVEKRLP